MTYEPLDTCTEWHERIALDVEGDLPTAEAAALSAHLEGCAACRDFARDMRASQDAWKNALGAPPQDDDLFAAIRGNVHREIGQGRVLPFRKPRRVWRYGLALAASAILAVALWRLDRPRPAPTPIAPPPAPTPIAPPPVVPPPAVPPVSPPPTPPATPVPPPQAASNAIWIDERPTADARWLEPPAAPSPPSLMKIETDDDNVVIYWLAEPAETTREKNDESTVYL